MVTCVASHRLERLRINDRYSQAQIGKRTFSEFRKAVLHALGMETWQQAEVIVKTKLIVRVDPSSGSIPFDFAPGYTYTTLVTRSIGNA
jgi:hypothetical protein